jgi:hypothetical protein
LVKHALLGRAPRYAVTLAIALLGAFAARPARATPTQIIVFLSSTQQFKEDLPKLSLFGYFYARQGVNLLGIYAGPRWTWGPFGLEFKTGGYGGTDIEARAILNNQMDLTWANFSLTSFTDFYPSTEIYSYLSAYANAGPIFGGAVADLTRDWSATPQTIVTGGPTVGAGTKAMYLGTTYVFSNEHQRWIRLTVGLTF